MLYNFSNFEVYKLRIKKRFDFLDQTSYKSKIYNLLNLQILSGITGNCSSIQYFISSVPLPEVLVRIGQKLTDKHENILNFLFSVNYD